MGRLSRKEIEELLRRPVISIVSTIHPDGSPHMTPVWHLVDNGDLVIAIEESSVKARNVRGNPHVALCVATDESPQRWALVRGEARLSRERVPEVVHAVSVHYMGDKEGGLYAETAVREFDFVLLRITPTKIIGFDGAD